ncbi:MAG TPA: YHS domain-containing (seleno)protein [Opitutaceae bacterium]
MKINGMFSVFALLILTAIGAGAADLVNKSFFGNLAVDGYDVVAYFTEGKPVKGTKEFMVEHNGAVYRFASDEHRALFEKDPGKYLPAYGGFCAWAVAEGGTAGIDPEAWTIFQDRLYLNYNKKVQATWEKDKAGNIARADAKWPGIVEAKTK